MVTVVGVGWQDSRWTLWRVAIRAAISHGVALAGCGGVSVSAVGGVGADWVVAARAWAALRAVRSAAAESLWRAVEIDDQRVATVRAVRRSRAARRDRTVAEPRSLGDMR
nr:hypothetical protein [Kribbella pittospori]